MTNVSEITLKILNCEKVDLCLPEVFFIVVINLQTCAALSNAGCAAAARRLLRFEYFGLPGRNFGYNIE